MELIGYSEETLAYIDSSDDGDASCWDCGAPIMRECICSDDDDD